MDSEILNKFESDPFAFPLSDPIPLLPTHFHQPLLEESGEEENVTLTEKTPTVKEKSNSSNAKNLAKLFTESYLEISLEKKDRLLKEFVWAIGFKVLGGQVLNKVGAWVGRVINSRLVELKMEEIQKNNPSFNSLETHQMAEQWLKDHENRNSKSAQARRYFHFVTIKWGDFPSSPPESLVDLTQILKLNINNIWPLSEKHLDEYLKEYRASSSFRQGSSSSALSESSLKRFKIEANSPEPTFFPPMQLSQTEHQLLLTVYLPFASSSLRVTAFSNRVIVSGIHHPPFLKKDNELPHAMHFRDPLDELCFRPDLFFYRELLLDQVVDQFSLKKISSFPHFQIFSLDKKDDPPFSL